MPKWRIRTVYRVLGINPVKKRRPSMDSPGKWKNAWWDFGGTRLISILAHILHFLGLGWITAMFLGRHSRPLSYRLSGKTNCFCLLVVFSIVPTYRDTWGTEAPKIEAPNKGMHNNELSTKTMKANFKADRIDIEATSILLSGHCCEVVVVICWPWSRRKDQGEKSERRRSNNNRNEAEEAVCTTT